TCISRISPVKRDGINSKRCCRFHSTRVFCRVQRTRYNRVMLPTIAREGDVVVMIDQRKLPAAEVYVRCKTASEVARAIKTMVIRGAPAIGVAAALGIALGIRKSKATGTQKLAAEFYKICEQMAATRP